MYINTLFQIEMYKFKIFFMYLNVELICSEDFTQITICYTILQSSLVFVLFFQFKGQIKMKLHLRILFVTRFRASILF
jgi:hypothetical protein